jgi:transposase
VRPDFKTIADFRKDNRAAFKPLFKHFNLLCRKLDLFGAELVAIDGSKFKAVNNIRRHYTQEQLQELVQKIEARIDDYLSQLDQQDAEAQGVAGAPSRQALEGKIAELKARQGKYEGLLQELVPSGQTEVSLTDPDSRGQKKVGVGYNVQVAVDAKHHLIVEAEVVPDANDRGQLSSMAAAAKQELGVDPLQVVADAGYHEAGQLEACEAAQIETYVSTPGSTSGRSTAGQEV